MDVRNSCLYVSGGKRQPVSCVDQVDYVISELVGISIMASSVISLKSYNSFSLPVSASCIKVADTQEKLIEGWHVASASQEPILLLGEGSNVLFLEDFLGTILLNRLKGIDLSLIHI